MFSWFQSPDDRVFKKLRQELSDLGELQANRRGIRSIENHLHAIVSMGLSGIAHPRHAQGGGAIYTPRQLKGMIIHLLMDEPEMAAFMVVGVFPRIASRGGFPMTLQGDMMMALEKIRAICPDKSAEGVSVLARALCMLPSLSRARETFAHLGVAYSHERLPDREVQRLANEGFVPEGTVIQGTSGYATLMDDKVIRQMVLNELQAVAPDAARLVARSTS